MKYTQRNEMQTIQMVQIMKVTTQQTTQVWNIRDVYKLKSFFLVAVYSILDDQ